jgi:hypothetical protein
MQENEPLSDISGLKFKSSVLGGDSTEIGLPPDF